MFKCWKSEWMSDSIRYKKRLFGIIHANNQEQELATSKKLIELIITVYHFECQRCILVFMRDTDVVLKGCLPEEGAPQLSCSTFPKLVLVDQVNSSTQRHFYQKKRE